MDAILTTKERFSTPSLQEAENFVTSMKASRQARAPSISLGDDYRSEGEGVVGTGLIVDGKVVHLAFFRDSLRGDDKPAARREVA